MVAVGESLGCEAAAGESSGCVAAGGVYLWQLPRLRRESAATYSRLGLAPSKAGS